MPAGAKVTVDGQPAAGAELDLAPGPHDIGVTAAGYDPFTTVVVVVAGQRHPVQYTARRVAVARQPTRVKVPPARPAPRSRPPVPPTGQLAVLKMRIQPWARLTLNGTSFGQRSQLVDTLIPGTAVLHLEREGYFSLDTTVTLSAGDNPPLLIRMKPRSR